MGARIREGHYRGRALAWAFGVTKNGNEQIAATFAITGEDCGPLSWFGFLNNEANAKRTMSSMRAMGWNGEGLVTEAQGLDANEVDLTVEDNDWEGEISSRVAWVNSIGPNVKPMNADQKSALNAKLAQWQKSPTNGGGQRRPQPPPKAPEPAGYGSDGNPAEDDIPF